MIHIKRIVNYIILMAFFNIILIINTLHLNIAIHIWAFLLLSAFFVYFNIKPKKDNLAQKRLRILAEGYELILAAILCFLLEILLYAIILSVVKMDVGLPVLISNAFVFTILLLVLLLNGILRIFLCSKQLGVWPRIFLLFLWWVPIVNLFILRRFFKVAGMEYVFTMDKYQRNKDREREEVCKTKYPILMVHGIFFRDWENFKYWGRIAEELKDNGAVIYYGNHQSTASVEKSAEELRQCIFKIVKETNCGKVNIIAHSKGGMDSRYAVSCLGMGEYVASLTTINTPHKGCNYVGKLLEVLPNKVVESFGKKYESIYTKLGDEEPDFFSGLVGLSDKECTRLNKIMVEDENVLCQSVGSRMKSHKSASFPLNIGYLITKFFEGDNDGLVSTKSMVWGNFLGVLNPKGKRGISHGDVIDLTRKNIEGFDICEFYVDLVSQLKVKGL